MKITLEANWDSRPRVISEKLPDGSTITRTLPWYTLEIGNMKAVVFYRETTDNWTYRVTDMLGQNGPESVAVGADISSHTEAKRLAEQAISDHVAVSR